MAEDTEQWLASLLRLGEEEKMTDKQIKIIQAAVEMFAEKGYAATSTSEIAERAGVAEGTIFRHYKTKKDLLIPIVAPIMPKLVAPFLRDFQKVLHTDYEHFDDFLRAVMRNRLEFAMRHAPVLKILLHEIPFHPELQAQFKAQIFPQVADRLVHIISHFQAKGELVQMPPLALLRLIVTTVAGYILLRTLVLREYDWNDEEEIERTIQFIMQGLRPPVG
ncbi:TetR/AcrR family transcriptional regulator [Alicyclobacillus herbarius]|uniref:TetR/AcrR family transcriptional regulator n=1 Tax=Alicyclobacillus herbarius TaxID=122960 RepID=UPI000404989E|nr:TetR/AcrR family transcriptional regulator [Alicyclobacillus herbarius]